MKKILGLALAAFMVMGLVGGGTWAYFSDPEVTGNNVLAAGTLDLDLDGGDDTGVTILNFTNQAPGDADNGSTTLGFTVTLDGELDIAFSTVDNTTGAGGTEWEGGSGELGANVEIAVFIDTTSPFDGYDAGTDIGLKSDGTIYTSGALQWASFDSYDSASWNDVYTGVVTSGAEDDFVIEWRIDGASVGNAIQGDSANCTITFTLEQAAAD